MTFEAMIVNTGSGCITKGRRLLFRAVGEQTPIGSAAVIPLGADIAEGTTGPVKVLTLYAPAWEGLAVGDRLEVIEGRRLTATAEVTKVTV